MLHARTVVEVQVLFDLRFATASGWFVNGKLNTPTTILHNLGHERGVLRANSPIIKVDKLFEAQHAFKKCYPLVHLPQLDITHNMVDTSQSSRARTTWYIRLFWPIAGQECA